MSELMDGLVPFCTKLTDLFARKRDAMVTVEKLLPEILAGSAAKECKDIKRMLSEHPVSFP